MWQRHDMSWHFVTFHGMLWHLHETTWHDMMVMSRRLMPAQGSEPETHTALVCRNWSWIQFDAYLGSNLICILDLIISWIQCDAYLGSYLICILELIWYTSWIQSDISYLGSSLIILDPIRDTSHSSLSYSTISTHTHTHSSSVPYPHPLAESSSPLRSREENIHRVISKYSKLTTLVNAIFSEELHHAGRIVIILWHDHPLLHIYWVPMSTDQIIIDVVVVVVKLLVWKAGFLICICRSFFGFNLV